MGYIEELSTKLISGEITVEEWKVLFEEYMDSVREVFENQHK